MLLVPCCSCLRHTELAQAEGIELARSERGRERKQEREGGQNVLVQDGGSPACGDDAQFISEQTAPTGVFIAINVKGRGREGATMKTRIEMWRHTLPPITVSK